ncbi:MAG: hypothetical protein GEU78_02455 [Actinobacteria bacterium]|nr:hypothetical protein [Actinomycetota bacterium]
MEGPGDEAPVPAGTVLEEGESPPRPPGGKALLRLLQMLESDGLTELAEETVQSAVSDEAVAEVMEIAAEAGIAPAGGKRPKRQRKSTARKSTARKSTTGRTARAEEPEPDEAGTLDDTATAESIATAYLEATEQMGPPVGLGPHWRSCGPWTVINGQTYGSSRVNVSGRVSALATDPSNAAHVLAGAANGGVWESFNRGASWSPRTDYQATLTVGALAFDRSAPATVYCGTGEGDWWSYLGVGILRSTNGGTTWSTLCTAPFVGQGFYCIVVDPADGRRLYAGTTRGLYVSTDRGVNWTRRRSARTWSISKVPGSAQILAGCSDGLFRSNDNGTTWTRIGLRGSPGSFDRLAVAIAPSNPRIAYAWGTGAPYTGPSSIPTAYLWRRARGVWTAVGIPPGAATGQSWYDWYLAVAPDRSNQIYCGAIDIHRGTLSSGTWTWVNLSSKTVGNSIHPDQHSIAFEPGAPNTVYAGNDGGVYRSRDRGITWVHCNNGLQISEFEYIAHHVGTSRWLIGGTQDNGTNRWTGPSTWEHVSDADGGDCGVNRANPQVVFHTWQWGRLWRSTNGGNFGSWVNITPARPAGEGPGLFYVPFECSATTGNTIAVGGQALYVSRDLGTTWTRLGFPAAGTASALYIPDADTVIVGLTDGRIFRTRWTGSWGALAALTTPRAGAWVSDLHATPGGGGRIWATSSRVGGGRVFRSEDGGNTWTNVSAGLPNLPINAVEVDSGNAQRVWVAADLGVYQSWNSGASWSNFSSALPNAYIGDLVFHPHARVLRAGTRNRGVWEIPVDGWMTQPWCGVQWTGSLAANETRRWFTWGWPATWHVLWTVMPTTPRPGAPQVRWTVEVERGDAERCTYWISVTNLTPSPLQFEGRFAVLSRY